MSGNDQNLNEELESSENIALQALMFISQDTKRLHHFLEITGLNAGQMRENIVIPDFLVGVLEYLLSDDSLLLSFCSNQSIDPQAIEPAKNYLEAELKA